MSDYVNGMDWCGVGDGEKEGGKRRMGKRRMWEMLGECQNPGTVKECQGQGECRMSVTSTLSLFKKNKSPERSDFAPTCCTGSLRSSVTETPIRYEK